MTSVADRIAALKKKEKNGVPALIKAKAGSSANWPNEKKRTVSKSKSEGASLDKQAQEVQKHNTSSVKDRIKLLQTKSIDNSSINQIIPRETNLQDDKAPNIPPRPLRKPKSLASNREIGKVELHKVKTNEQNDDCRTSKDAKESPEKSVPFLQVQSGKHVSKKIQELATNIALPGLISSEASGQVVRNDKRSEAYSLGRIKHLTLERPSMKAGKRRRPKNFKKLARNALELNQVLEIDEKNNDESEKSAEIQGKEGEANMPAKEMVNVLHTQESETLKTDAIHKSKHENLEEQEESKERLETPADDERNNQIKAEEKPDEEEVETIDEA